MINSLRWVAWFDDHHPAQVRRSSAIRFMNHESPPAVGEPASRKCDQEQVPLTGVVGTDEHLAGDLLLSPPSTDEMYPFASLM
jgi:hypothetical protein